METAELPVMRAERFVFSAIIEGSTHKIFQIVFHSGAKSGETYCFVNFPYFYRETGLISRLTFPANKIKAKKLSLVPEGKVTSHLVKYSHPFDGLAHFSADGKVVTAIRNQSKRLDVDNGHMFTLQIQGLDGFELRDSPKSFKKKKVDVDFKFEKDTPLALKFIGRWYKSSSIKGHSRGKEARPHFFLYGEHNNPNENGFLISPPETSPISDFVMLVSCVSIPLLDKQRKSVFSFIGGFDETNDIKSDFHFLSCIYPTNRYQKLLDTIGSIDYNMHQTKS